MGGRAVRQKARAPVYAALYPMLLRVCRAHGYALAIHGSMTKDFDLIAVPWTEESSAPEVLAAAVVKRISTDWWFGVKQDTKEPAQKPHGRLVWTIMLVNGLYLDFGVMTPTPGGSDD